MRHLLLLSLLLSGLAAVDRPIEVLGSTNQPVPLQAGDNYTLRDAANVVLGSTTGTKIGTATSQKLAFYNSTPVIQQTGDVATALSTLGLVATPTVVATTAVDGTFRIIGSGDPTKKFAVEVDSQTTAKTLTLNTGPQTLDRSLSVPVLGQNSTIAVIDQAQSFAGTQTFTGSIAQTGTGTVSTGTGAISLNGDTTVASGKSLTLPAGAVGTPSMPIGASATTGFYSSGSGAVDIALAGVDLVRFTTSLSIIATPLEVDGATSLVGNTGITGALTVTGKISSSKASAAANITDANSSLKLYDASLGAGLFGMQTTGSPYAFQLQVADATMASQFPLSLNPLGGAVTVGAGGLAVTGTVSLGSATANSTEVINAQYNTGANPILFTLKNGTAGTGVYTGFRLKNDTTSVMDMILLSTTFSTTGVFVADRGFIQSSASAGIGICAFTASAPIIIAAGGITETARFISTGLDLVSGKVINIGNANFQLGALNVNTGLGIFDATSNLLAVQCNSSVVAYFTTTRLQLQQPLRLENAYVATPQVSTGYVTMQDSTGTTYKLLVAP